MRHIYSILALLVLIAALTGCTSLGRVPVSPEIQTIRSYEIGEMITATTGSPVIRVGKVKERPLFQAAESFFPPRTLGRMRTDSIDSSMIWVATHATQEPPGYIIESPEYSNRFAVHILEDGSIGLGWLSLPRLETVEAPEWPEGQLFERTPFGLEEASAIAEIVYSGLFGGNTARFLYREYIDDMVRPAFTQELSYDLDEANPITFRSLQIEVEEATNNRIRVRVIEDGGLTWLPVPN